MAQGKVLVKATEHQRQMMLLVPSLPMHMSLEPVVGTIQKLPAALRTRNADYRDFTVPVRAADVFEAQKLEGFRFRTVFGHSFAGETPEAQHAGLFRCEFKTKLLHPLFEDAVEAFGVALVLKARDKIVGKPDKVGLPLTPRLEPLLEPEVENVV
jgi:hypothetical protein